ncbi:MAG: hypothetical protein Kow00109_02960 [Acidobacteriota bacterium]
MVSGDYLEVRSNHVYTCGCLYSGEQVTGGREAVLAWNFREGDFAGHSLQDVRAVAVLMGATTLSIGDSPRVSVLYLDGVPAEKEADFLRWMQSRYGNLLGDVLAAHRVPIRFTKDDDAWEVVAGDDVHLRVRRTILPDDAHLGSLQWYDPFIPLAETELVTIQLDEYAGPDLGMRWRRLYPEITGFRGEFRTAAATVEQRVATDGAVDLGE